MPNRLDISRRSFLGTAIAGSAAAAADAARGQTTRTAIPKSAAVLDVLRVADHATAYAGLRASIALTRSPQGVWQTKGVELAFEPSAAGVAVFVSSPGHELTHVHLRWSADMKPGCRVLGDHWERSYGDLAWRGIVPERVMPWYFLTWDGALCHGYGVKTSAGALCFWQVDGEGVSLWLDLSNGGEGVQLGSRRLHAATIVSRAGKRDGTAFESARAFCRIMCDKPRLPSAPLYGSNDWYYAYGKNLAEQTVRDAELMAELSSGLPVRPFTVIDDG